MRATSILLLVAIALPACSGPPDASARVSAGGPDRATFKPVAGVLVARCGSLDCHGSKYRNLRLYGFGGERLDPVDRPDTPSQATPAEIDADYDAVVSLEPELTAQVVAAHGDGADRLTFIRKMRGAEAHKGGQRIVPGSDDDRCVLTWLSGAPDATLCKP